MGWRVVVGSLGGARHCGLFWCHFWELLLEGVIFAQLLGNRLMFERVK